MEPYLAIFDLDGTLADTKRGILSSWRQIAPGMNVPEPPDLEVALDLGEPFFDVLRNRFGFSGNDIFRAARINREYYSREGYKESDLYPDMTNALHILHDDGAAIAIATMKLDDIANRMVSLWGLDDVISTVCGGDPDGRLRKADMIARCLELTGVDSSRAILIGDTLDDLNGASKSGIQFLAVTYGDGFTEESCQDMDIDYVNGPSEIPNMIHSLMETGTHRSDGITRCGNNDG